MHKDRDAQLDHLVDTRNISYDEAHKILGPEEPVADFSVDEATVARNAFHAYATDEFRLNPRAPRTEEERQAQIATDRQGRALVDAELAKIRESRGEV